MCLPNVSAVAYRLAKSSDIDPIAALHAESWRRNYRGAYSDAFLDGDVLTYRRAAWTSRLSGPQSASATIVAEMDGAIIGFAHVILDDDPRWGSLLDNLHVSAGWQRHGIGSALITHAAGAVIERAASRSIYLWVLEQNGRAQAFYAAHGGQRSSGPSWTRPGACRRTSPVNP